MIFLKQTLAAALFFFALEVRGGGYFDWSPNEKLAYEKALSLRFDESRGLLAQLKKDEPENLMTDFVEDYVDFLTVFLTEDKAEFERLEANRSRRLERFENGDASSPYFLYAQAAVTLHWAILRGKFERYLSAVRDVKSAYAMLEKNQKLHPDFVANRLPLGIMQTFVGTIPDDYRWAVKMLAGMDGTIPSGLAEVEKVVEHGRKNAGFVFKNEALVAYSFLMLHLGNDSEKAWKTIKNSGFRAENSPLEAFSIANIALRTGRTDEAIRCLEKCPMGGPFFYFHYRNFMLGLAKLYRLDADANVGLEAFVQNFGGRYYVKEAYQKLAWHRLISGDIDGYHRHIESVKTRGGSKLESDKAAKREAEKGIAPDPNLLRARLLFDGGYHQKAYDFLAPKADWFPDPRRGLEWRYRMGIICHALKKWDESALFYQRTIDEGAGQPFYFACNAALQMGLLFEEQRKWAEARAAFKRCLALDSPEFSDAIHAKAKAGLGRIKNR